MPDEHDQRLMERLRVSRSLHGNDPFIENQIIAHDVVTGEIRDHTADAQSLAYHLDQPARDTLIAHGRQDAAHALCNTKSLMDDIGALRRELRVWRVVGLVALALLAWIAWHVGSVAP